MVGAFALRHPFVPLALAYGLGVWAAWKWPVPLPWLFSVRWRH